jgi:uncharacterized membrane protein
MQAAGEELTPQERRAAARWLQRVQRALEDYAARERG